MDLSGGLISDLAIITPPPSLNQQLPPKDSRNPELDRTNREGEIDKIKALGFSRLILGTTPIGQVYWATREVEGDYV